MADVRSESLLSHAADLERRDEALAAQIAAVAEPLLAVERLRARAQELDAFLAAAPAALAALDRQETEAREAKARAEAALAAAEERVSALAGRRRASQEERDQAQRELRQAREAARDAAARVARIDRKREQLRDDERIGRAEADGIAVQARRVSGRIGALPRVSESGRAAPGPTLGEVAEWGARARAALLVVRGQLEAERDRVVAEAGSLGAVVLGEELAGASVASVRRRLEQALLS